MQVRMKHHGHKEMLSLAVYAGMSAVAAFARSDWGLKFIFVQCKKTVAHCTGIAKNEIAGRVHGYTTAWFFSLSHPQEIHP